MLTIAITSEVDAPGRPRQNSYSVNTDYVEYVIATGAMPMPVCIGMSPATIAKMADGLLLTGGRDVSPIMYGADFYQNGSSRSCIYRDRFEKDLYREFIKAGKPIFGICRGFQLIGVLFECELDNKDLHGKGLKLEQEIIKDQDVHIAHYQNAIRVEGDNPIHAIINQGAVKEIMGEDATPVNSNHHQGFFLSNSRNGQIVSQDSQVLGHARTRDKARVLEALLLKVKNKLGKQVLVGGVQYHPERMLDYLDSRREKYLRLFRYVMGINQNEYNENLQLQELPENFVAQPSD